MLYDSVVEFPAKNLPAKIPCLKMSGRLPVDMGIPALNSKIMFESDPLLRIVKLTIIVLLLLLLLLLIIIIIISVIVIIIIIIIITVTEITIQIIIRRRRGRQNLWTETGRRPEPRPARPDACLRPRRRENMVGVNMVLA